jgi:hypothetical protein
MATFSSRGVLAAFFLLGLASAPQASPDGEQLLFNFEKPEDLQGWANLEIPGQKEPAVVVERSAEKAASGKHSLKITFAGGIWPAAAASRVPADWTNFKTLKAEVTVERPCVVGFTLFQEKSQRGDGWAPVISRWTTTEFLSAGKNSIRASLEDRSGNGYMLNKAKYGSVTALEIFMYAPHPGESIWVDDLRASPEREPAAADSRKFKVLGTPWVVSGVQELGKKLKEKWTAPSEKTIEQVESEFRAEAEALKKSHPGAQLTILRNGEAGPDGKVYAGWKDAHLESHGPDTNTFWRAKKYGGDGTGEAFMRHRSLLLKADLSVIPARSEILAARLILARASKLDPERNPTTTPSMWAAEACNRPWDELEVNGYQYAKDKFWKSVGGLSSVSYSGEDPDFQSLYLAYGPSQGKVNSWDFREALKYWTDGSHENHGFMLHGDGGDYMMAHCRESSDVKSRPALLVVYEPGK